MNRLATRELNLFRLGVVAVILVLSTFARADQPAEEKSTAGVATVDDMPAVLDPRNLYSEAGAGISVLPSTALWRGCTCPRSGLIGSM